MRLQRPCHGWVRRRLFWLTRAPERNARCAPALSVKWLSPQRNTSPGSSVLSSMWQTPLPAAAAANRAELFACACWGGAPPSAAVSVDASTRASLSLAASLSIVRALSLLPTSPPPPPLILAPSHCLQLLLPPSFCFPRVCSSSMSFNTSVSDPLPVSLSLSPPLPFISIVPSGASASSPSLGLPNPEVLPPCAPSRPLALASPLPLPPAATSPWLALPSPPPFPAGPSATSAAHRERLPSSSRAAAESASSSARRPRMRVRDETGSTVSPSEPEPERGREGGRDDERWRHAIRAHSTK
eukprot:scaffold274767_cov27-Tisochrysis_lutea.AAC.1